MAAALWAAVTGNGDIRPSMSAAASRRRTDILRSSGIGGTRRDMSKRSAQSQRPGISSARRLSPDAGRMSRWSVVSLPDWVRLRSARALQDLELHTPVQRIARIVAAGADDHLARSAAAGQ